DGALSRRAGDRAASRPVGAPGDAVGALRPGVLPLLGVPVGLVRARRSAVGVAGLGRTVVRGVVGRAVRGAAAVAVRERRRPARAAAALVPAARDGPGRAGARARPRPAGDLPARVAAGPPPRGRPAAGRPLRARPPAVRPGGRGRARGLDRRGLVVTPAGLVA